MSFNSLLYSITLTVSSTLVIVLAIAYRYQSLLIYPSSIPPNSRLIVDTPDLYGMKEYSRQTLKTSDGIYLDTFTIHSSSSNTKPQTIVLFLHANAGNMGHRLPIAQRLLSTLNCSIFMLSYRGYGKSTGTSFFIPL